MRYLILLLLTGCGAGTTVSYNPETGAAHFEREWLAGPVDTGVRVEKPDGTKVEFWWRSEVDLSSAEAVELGRQNVVMKALEKIPASGGAP